MSIKIGKWKKRITWVIASLSVLIIVISSYFFMSIYSATKEAYIEIDRPDNKSELRIEEVRVSKDPISILLLGIEDYETNGQNGRSDTMIVVTLNPHTKSVTMTTIPRDTRVEFTEEEAGIYEGFHKINAAYTYGSMFGYGENELAVKKVEELLGIPIDEYIAVKFDGFREIVDILGGVTIDIKEPFWEKNFYRKGEEIQFEKGENKLNGEEALAFVRMRKRDVNVIYSREERQRQFIKAMVEEAIATNTLFKVRDISTILGKNVMTSLSPTELYHLQRLYASVDLSELKTFEIEGQNERIDGIYYFLPLKESILDVTEKIKQELELVN